MSVMIRCPCGFSRRFPDDAVPPRRCPACDEILRVVTPEKPAGVPNQSKSAKKSPSTSKSEGTSSGRGVAWGQSSAAAWG